MTTIQRPRSRAFPLNALFLLVALVAITAANLSPLFAAEIEPIEMAMAAGLGAVAGIVFGAIIGLYHFRRQRGFLVGCMTGCITGAVTGPLCAIAMKEPWQAMTLSSLGGLSLIGMSLAYRALNSDDPVINKHPSEPVKSETPEPDASSATSMPKREIRPD